MLKTTCYRWRLQNTCNNLLTLLLLLLILLIYVDFFLKGTIFYFICVTCFSSFLLARVAHVVRLLSLIGPALVLPIFIVPVLLLFAVPSSLTSSALSSASTAPSLSPPPSRCRPRHRSCRPRPRPRPRRCPRPAVGPAVVFVSRVDPLFLLVPAKMDGEQEGEREREQRLSEHH